MPCSPKFMREFKIECLIFQKYGRILFVTNVLNCWVYFEFVSRMFTNWRQVDGEWCCH